MKLALSTLPMFKIKGGTNILRYIIYYMQLCIVKSVSAKIRL